MRSHAVTNHRYEVRKIGMGDGPVNTSTVADRMKPWVQSGDSSDDDDSED